METEYILYGLLITMGFVILCLLYIVYYLYNKKNTIKASFSIFDINNTEKTDQNIKPIDYKTILV